jgi:hypothetical protein
MGSTEGTGRHVWLTYGGVAALCIAVRVFVLLNLLWHPRSTAFPIEWVLRPEVTVPAWPSWVPAAVFWGVALTLGSLVMTAPVLAVGWLLRRLRLSKPIIASYLVCGTALATARICVLASAHGTSWTAPWHLVWLLWPEALLVMDTRYDPSFAFLVLLALGGYIMAMPILLIARLTRHGSRGCESD